MRRLRWAGEPARSALPGKDPRQLAAFKISICRRAVSVGWRFTQGARCAPESMWSLVRWVASSFAVDSVSRNLVSGSTRWTLGTPDPIFLRENRTFTLLLLQVSKFDQQDIFAGERVELTSGQTATVLEVFASNQYLLSLVVAGGARDILQCGL